MAPQTDASYAHREPTSPPPIRRIIHIDMDAFFAAVEQLDREDLRGRPVVVGGDPNERGVVAAASYEARKFGVRSAMPMSRAMRLCPDLVRVPPRFGRYAAISGQIRAILHRITPLVEPISLDEAYLDVSSRLEPAAELARSLKETILAETGLTASAGVGPCKLVAKIASDAGKPDGLVVIPPSRVRTFLAPQSVGRIWGVGPVTERKLAALEIHTIGDLAAAQEERLRASLGPAGVALRQLALGHDDRAVVAHRPTRSISCERTLSRDTKDLNVLDALIVRFAEELESSLAHERAMARTVTLRIRYADFTQVSRCRTVATPFSSQEPIVREARALLFRTLAGRRHVRLIGVGLTGIIPHGEPCQRDLFSP